MRSRPALASALPPTRRVALPARERGLTLIEMTIVLAVSAIFVAFVGQALISAATAYNEVSKNLASQSQLRFAMERITRELREIRTVAGNPPDYDITTPATPTNGVNNIVFVKNDGTTVTITGASGTAVNITYSSPAATGRLADIASTGALAFNFYDHNTNGVTASTSYNTVGRAPANLGAIQFTLTVTVDGVANTATSRVAMRAIQ